MIACSSDGRPGRCCAYLAGPVLQRCFAGCLLWLYQLLQVITWKLEVEDGKCRPSGSPPRDTSLAAFADLRIGNGAACMFPHHADDCKCVPLLISANSEALLLPVHVFTATPMPKPYARLWKTSVVRRLCLFLLLRRVGAALAIAC